MPAPALIALDWGTSNLRASLLDAGGSDIETRSAPGGVMAVQGGRFAEALLALCGDWILRFDCPLIASGMVGSRQGWVEAPYRDCQARLVDVAAALTPVALAGGATLHVVGNPGLVPAAAYAGVTDAIVSFEGGATTFQNFDPRTSTPWLYTLTNSRHAMLVHNADNCTAMQTAVQAAASARYNHGLVYATNLQYNPTTQVGNPWASLPSYWSSLVGTVRAINTATALPAC